MEKYVCFQEAATLAAPPPPPLETNEPPPPYQPGYGAEDAVPPSYEQANVPPGMTFFLALKQLKIKHVSFGIIQSFENTGQNNRKFYGNYCFISGIQFILIE